MPKQLVKLYIQPDCPSCDEAEALLQDAINTKPVDILRTDIENDPVFHQLYADHVPVLDFGSQRLYWPFTAEDVQQILQRTAPQPTVTGRTRDLVIWVDKFVYHFSKHWLIAIGAIIGLYAGLPLLAPLLMAAGIEGPANLIYSAYRFGCHQLPSRSYFIGGHQIAYCQRCMATYTSLFLSVILFAFVRRWLKPLSWKMYVLFLVPLALDGVSQLLGLRASNWLLRTITGALFGFGSAWMAFPYLEQGFRDARQSVEEQLRMG
jgi:uncharacterized membrane protein